MDRWALLAVTSQLTGVHTLGDGCGVDQVTVTDRARQIRLQTTQRQRLHSRSCSVSFFEWNSLFFTRRWPLRAEIYVQNNQKESVTRQIRIISKFICTIHQISFKCRRGDDHLLGKCHDKVKRLSAHTHTHKHLQ